MTRHVASLAGLALAASLLLIPTTVAAADPPVVASAVLHDSSGERVGAAIFTQHGSGPVGVVAITVGLPSGLHGLHVHAVGSCVGPDFTSAGPHFNPLGARHGSHAGDLPNLSVRSSGLGIVITTTDRFALSPGQLSIFDADGAALVIHAAADDYVTDPTGNSGARIACGIIRPVGMGDLLGRAS